MGILYYIQARAKLKQPRKTKTNFSMLINALCKNFEVIQIPNTDGTELGFIDR